jgi:hypothetical protein
MRNTVLLLSVAACAAQPVHPTTTPVAYACDNSVQLAHDGKRLDIKSAADAGAPDVQLGWVDDAGDHYVDWPLGVTTASSVEYVIPHDQHADAIERHYDTRQGASRADWRLVSQSTCAVHGGYTDALTRFAAGASMDEIKTELSLADKEEARTLVHDAMIKLTRRYYHAD